jgi:hypothetical protein
MDQGTSEEETKAEEEPKVEDAGEETKVENIEEEKATKEEQVAAEEESGELKINPLLVHVSNLKKPCVHLLLHPFLKNPLLPILLFAIGANVLLEFLG